MNRTWLLLRTQIMNFLPINEIRGSQVKKKNAAIIIAVGIAMAVVFLCIYNILTAQALVQIKEQELIPAYTVTMSSFSILFLTMLRTNDILFGAKDVDMLLSLPVKISEIVCSKFLFMYLLNLFIGVIFIVPGGVIWIMHTEIDILRFILYFVSIFFIPLIPMCLAALLGILIVIISSRFKNQNSISLLFSFIALGFIGYIGVFYMQKENTIGSLGAALAKQITGIYPLSTLFLMNTKLPVVVGMIVFTILSSTIFYFFIKITATNFSRFHTLIHISSKYTRRKNTKKHHSPFFALYYKELDRFFCSYLTVLNTGFSIILLCLFSILLLIISPQQLGSLVGIEDINNLLSNYSPLIIAGMLSLCCPAAFSISLEGKSIWILQSSPISIGLILKSKIAVNLTLHAFGYLFAIFAIIIRINMNILQLISLLIIPVCYSLFIVIFGIFLNKKYPNYEWNTEMIIVKQSIPVIISSMVGMLIITIPVLFHWIFSFSIMAILWGVAIFLLITAILMYQRISLSSYI